MSDEACKLQLQRLDLGIKHHDEQIKANKVMINDHSIVLDKIITMLSQIRWVVTGGMGFFVIENIGLVEAIKKLLGL